MLPLSPFSFDDASNQPYYRAQNPPVVAPAPVPAVTSAVAADAAGKQKGFDPFYGMKAGTTRDFSGFTGAQVGAPGHGMTVIGGVPSTLGSIQTLMTQGWTPQTATAAASAAAEGDLTRTRTGLLPAESAATVAKTNADTNLIGQQAAVIAPEATARIAGINAETGLTNVNAQVQRRQWLQNHAVLSSAIDDILKQRTKPVALGQ